MIDFKTKQLAWLDKIELSELSDYESLKNSLNNHIFKNKFEKAAFPSVYLYKMFERWPYLKEIKYIKDSKVYTANKVNSDIYINSKKSSLMDITSVDYFLSLQHHNADIREYNTLVKKYKNFQKLSVASFVYQEFKRGEIKKTDFVFLSGENGISGSIVYNGDKIKCSHIENSKNTRAIGTFLIKNIQPSHIKNCILTLDNILESVKLNPEKFNTLTVLKLACLRILLSQNIGIPMLIKCWIFIDKCDDFKLLNQFGNTKNIKLLKKGKHETI